MWKMGLRPFKLVLIDRVTVKATTTTAKVSIRRMRDLHRTDFFFK